MGMLALRDGAPGDHAHAPALEALGAAGGAVLAASLGAVGRLRGDRPLHPHGASYAARVRLHGAARSAVPWLDEPGSWRATLRVSRGIGLPAWLPDVHGIALRVLEGPEGPFDVLVAHTGSGPLSRFVFLPRGRVADGALTTLLPVRSGAGPLVLRLAAPLGASLDANGMPSRLDLSYAHGLGAWHPAGEVLVGERLGPAAERAHHDPVLHQLPDTDQYRLVRRLREPAYATARAVSAGASGLTV
jgi:hypothetical protein